MDFPDREIVPRLMVKDNELFSINKLSWQWPTLMINKHSQPQFRECQKQAYSKPLVNYYIEIFSFQIIGFIIKRLPLNIYISRFSVYGKISSATTAPGAGLHLIKHKISSTISSEGFSLVTRFLNHVVSWQQSERTGGVMWKMFIGMEIIIIVSCAVSRQQRERTWRVV